MRSDTPCPCPVLSRLPFLRRTARPILGRPLLWCVAGGLGLFTYAVHGQLDGVVAFYLLLIAGFAGYTAMRALDDDQATGTFEQLEVLPVSRARIVLETAAGALGAYAILIAVPIALGALSARGAMPWGRLLHAVPWLVGLPLFGTLVSLRHRMHWLAKVAWIAILGGVLLGAGRVFDSNFSAFRVDLVRPGLELAGVLATWALGWRLAHVMGGGWSEQDRSSAVRTPGTAAPRERLAPDNLHPLLWRELTLGWRGMLVMFVLGAAGIASAGPHRWDSPGSRFVNVVMWTVVWSCLSSSLRTSEDRLSGMWADLATTPLSTGSILWCRVTGMLAQALVMTCGWGALVVVLPGESLGWQLSGLLIGTLFTALLQLAGVLSGFVAGTSGKGLLAGLVGLFLMYILMLAALMPAAFLASVFESSRHLNPALAVIFTIAGFVLTPFLYYGTLIKSALSGIRRAAEEQRA